jgi:hypothetical protein
MKHIFLFCVLIFSLLAVCNCKHDLSPSSENTNSETGQEKTVPQEDEAQEVLTDEGETQEVEAGENEKPVVIQEDETLKEGTQENETQETEEDGTQEVEEKENETQEIEGENEEIVPPEIEELEFAILQINELRPEIINVGNSAEYIEFKVIKGGGMEGLYLYIMINAQDTFVYIFPPIDVETGEYITLHLRELDKYKCFDELREDELSLSGGIDSCPTARDLWVTGNNKLLNKTGIVYLQDEYGRIMDAIVMIEKPGTAWNSNQEHFAETMEKLFKCGMWQAANGNNPTPLDAVDTSAIGKNAYKSVSRYEGKENTHSAKDWFIAGYITPGVPNK